MPYILKCHSHLFARGYRKKDICPILNDDIGQILHGTCIYSASQQTISSIILQILCLINYKSFLAKPLYNHPAELIFLLFLEINMRQYTCLLKSQSLLQCSKNLGTPRKQHFLDHISIINLTDTLNSQDEN